MSSCCPNIQVEKRFEIMNAGMKRLDFGRIGSFGNNLNSGNTGSVFVNVFQIF